MMPKPVSNFFLCVMLLSLGSCSREPGLRPDAPKPVGFSAELEPRDHAETRAAGDMDLATLREKGFGVFACYTGLHRYAESSVTSDFMHNQEVTWDAGHEVWTYDPLKYWPNGEGEGGSSFISGDHYVSFFAYAPYSDMDDSSPSTRPEGYCISTCTNPLEVGDPWILYRIHPDPYKQVDLLYAAPLLDRVKTGSEDCLPFHFRHALSNVGEEISVSCSESLRERLDEGVGTLYDDCQLVLTGVSLHGSLTEKARLDLWNRGTANWQPILSENRLVETGEMEVFSGEHVLYTSSTAASTPWTGTGRGLFYIPLETDGYPQTATVSVHCLIRHTVAGEVTQTERNGDVLLYLKEFSQEGKTLTINIYLQNL